MKALTETTILAVHSLHLMSLKEAHVNVSAISRSSGFPAERIRGIVEKLRKAGLVKDLPDRGFALAKAPGEIKIEEIVAATEEPMAPKAPCGGNYEECASHGSCMLAPLCRSAAQSAQETLRSYTLAELMETRFDLPNCMNSTPREGTRHDPTGVPAAPG